MANRKRSKRHAPIKSKPIRSVDDYLNTIMLYCDNKPVYGGSAVFLKQDKNIIYDRKLRSLITSGHRFLIIEKTSNKISTILISLLSTSSFMNEKLELGIKLFGKYHSDKDVYLDAVNSWIIPVSCVKSVDYRIDESDYERSVVKFFNFGFDATIIKKGVINDPDVDRDTPIYTERMSKVRTHFKYKLRNITSDDGHDLNINLLKEYIYSLTDDEVKDYIVNKIPPDLYEYLYNQVLQNDKYDPETSSIDRSILFAYIWGTDSELKRVLNLGQRGY